MSDETSRSTPLENHVVRSQNSGATSDSSVDNENGASEPTSQPEKDSSQVIRVTSIGEKIRSKLPRIRNPLKLLMNKRDSTNDTIGEEHVKTVVEISNDSQNDVVPQTFSESTLPSVPEDDVSVHWSDIHVTDSMSRDGPQGTADYANEAETTSTAATADTRASTSIHN